MAKTAFPDGIDQDACESGAPNRVVLARFALFIAILTLALLGVFGGGKSVSDRVVAPAATLEVEAPERLRNGNFFEMSFRVTARQPIADAVIAIPGRFWHDVTINSLVPAPENEEFRGEHYLIHLGPVAAGETIQLKIDGQLNPPLFGIVRGDYRLLDGERELARLPASLKVLP